MTTFLVFVAVLAAGGVALAAAGVPDLPDLPGLRRFRRTGTRAHGVSGVSLADPDPRLPAVLLPENPSPPDIGRLRFSVGLRGYRMDQVDAVLARLATALADRDAALEAALKAARQPPAVDGGKPGGRP